VFVAAAVGGRLSVVAVGGGVGEGRVGAGVGAMGVAEGAKRGRAVAATVGSGWGVVVTMRPPQESRRREKRNAERRRGDAERRRDKNPFSAPLCASPRFSAFLFTLLPLH
jgi:hypothetical protein